MEKKKVQLNENLLSFVSGGGGKWYSEKLENLKCPNCGNGIMKYDDRMIDVEISFETDCWLYGQARCRECTHEWIVDFLR